MKTSADNNTVRHEKSLTGLKRLKKKKVKKPLSGDKNVTWLTLISTSSDTRKSICIWVPTEQWLTNKRTRRPTFYWQSRFTNNKHYLLTQWSHFCWSTIDDNKDFFHFTNDSFQMFGASIITSPLTSNNLNIGLLNSNNVYNS